MAIVGGYVVAQASKITINSGKSTQATVKGLQGMALPIGATASTISISTIGQRIGTKVATGLEYDPISTTYYFAKGDPTQQYLMKCSREGIQIQDMWFWIDGDDFAAVDKINDPGGYMMVGTFGAPTAQKNEVYTGSVELVISGSHIFFDRHISGTTLSFTAGGAGVDAQASHSGNGFVAAGFKVGDTVILVNVDGMDPLYAKIATVSPGSMTFEDGVGDEASIPTFTGISSTVIHGAEPVEVIDTY